MTWLQFVVKSFLLQSFYIFKWVIKVSSLRARFLPTYQTWKRRRTRMFDLSKLKIRKLSPIFDNFKTISEFQYPSLQLLNTSWSAGENIPPENYRRLNGGLSGKDDTSARYRRHTFSVTESRLRYLSIKDTFYELWYHFTRPFSVLTTACRPPGGTKPMMIN